jgi:hypothetical protein
MSSDAPSRLASLVKKWMPYSEPAAAETANATRRFFSAVRRSGSSVRRMKSHVAFR